MGKSDGSVRIEVQLDAPDVEKELGRIKREVLKLEEALDFKGAKLDNLTRELDSARAKLAELKATANTGFLANGGTLYPPETAQQINNLQASIAAMESEQKKLTADIGQTNVTLATTKERYGQVAMAAKQLPPEIEKTDGVLKRIEKRIGRLAARVFFFSIITSGLRSLKNWFVDVIKTDKDAVAAIAQLKGALLTLVQPLVNVVIPAFTTFVQVLTQVISTIASVVASVFGTTVEQAAEAAENLDDEKKALGGVGAAAKKAGKSMASFDEINKLSGGDETAGGGAGAASAGIEPDFSFLDTANDKIQQIADLVLLIGSGFAFWKLGTFLGELAQVFPALSGLLGPLGEILTKIGGLAIAIGGVVLAVNGLTDAWENGVNWRNAAEMIAGVALAAVGLGMAFGPVGAGIALVVGGLAMLVTGFHDAMENGWNLQNTLLTIAGILSTGLGIALLTGSWIPLLIAGIASVLLAITVATGHGEELISGIKDIIQGFLDFFTGIFSGDMQKAIGGIETMFGGLKTAIHAVLDGIKDFFLKFLDWLDEKTGGKLHGIIQFAEDIVTGFFDQIKGMIDGLIQVLQGFITFLTGIFTANFDLAWEGVKQIFVGFVNSILAFFVGGVNLIIKAMNFVIDKLNGISFDVPDWVPGIGGEKVGISIPTIQEYQIPRLATGAVIPPNREFLAVLGDQKSGNNIEAPEALLRQMAADAAGANTALLQKIINLMESGRVLVVNDTTFAELVYNSNNNARNRHGSSLVTVRSMG